MILDDLKKHLTDEEILSTGEAVFYNYSQSNDNCIILWEYGGFSPRFAISEQRKTIQVMVKNTSMSTAQSKSHAIYNELCTEYEFKIINSRKVSIQAAQPPFFLEKDQQNRYIYVFNIVITSSKD